MNAPSLNCTRFWGKHFFSVKKNATRAATSRWPLTYMDIILHYLLPANKCLPNIRSEMSRARPCSSQTHDVSLTLNSTFYKASSPLIPKSGSLLSPPEQKHQYFSPPERENYLNHAVGSILPIPIIQLVLFYFFIPKCQISNFSLTLLSHLMEKLSLCLSLHSLLNG